jgi:hypothetical protein
MKIFIVQFPFGVAAFDENNGLVEKSAVSQKRSGCSKKLS